MEPLFRQVTRYLPSDLRDPREDRLTEVLAAVLVRVPGLPNLVAGALLGEDPPPGRVEVRTQARYASVHAETDLRIDLELRTGNRLIWVESKHGAAVGLREGGQSQVQNYLAEIGEHSRHGTVVVLHPRGGDARVGLEHVPAPALKLTWQALAERLRAFGTSDPVQRFLLKELHDYLELEDLVDPPALTAADVSVLLDHRDALRSLESLCLAAGDSVARQWNHPTHVGRRPLNFYEMHLDHAVGKLPLAVETGWWQWGVMANFAPEVDGLVVYAGVRAAGDTRFLHDTGAEERSGFHLYSDTPFDRLYRVAPLAEVATGATITDQGGAVASWVVKAFDSLAKVYRP